MSGDKKQATWGGRFSEGPAELMLRIGESVSFDHRLAPFDVQGSKAQAAMLAHVGLISDAEAKAIRDGLDAVLEEIESGAFEWDPALEDVHMNIEQALTEKVPTAAKLHTARSRNDQVATDMRLFFKAACDQVDASLSAVIGSLVELAERTQSVIIPGYTHLQRAQPVSMAHHLLAYVEMFDRDRSKVAAVKEQANVCPLGSGAIAGTTLPIDREFVAKELGFVNALGQPIVTQNSMDAVSDRDTFIAFAAACATIGIHLSRMSEDFILWSSSEFAFVRLPDAFTTGSSLMPQKKNPDALEIIRGRVGRLVGARASMVAVLKGLPTAYNKDLQDDKAVLFGAADDAVLLLRLAARVVEGLRVNETRAREAAMGGHANATDLADEMVRRGVPFREAHERVGVLVRTAIERGAALEELAEDDVRAVWVELDAGAWGEVAGGLTPEACLARRSAPGGASPERVGEQVRAWRDRLGMDDEADLASSAPRNAPAVGTKESQA